MPRPRKTDQLAPTADLACDDRIVHVEAVRRARTALPTGGVLAGLADVFAALGDPTRLRIVAALAGGELCVCDLAAVLSLSQSAVSHQLRLLRGMRLVRPRRDGRVVFYSLDDQHIISIFKQTLQHVGETTAAVSRSRVRNAARG